MEQLKVRMPRCGGCHFKIRDIIRPDAIGAVAGSCPGCRNSQVKLLEC